MSSFPEGISIWRDGIDERANDAAARWLREHDPRASAAGIADEIEGALLGEGLSIAEAQAAFRKSGGRPTRQLLTLRARVARALSPMWDDDRRRDYMAAAMGCDRKTLRRLMAKPPHGSYL